MRKRYTSMAISLHWLIAFLLIGLIAVGKYMNELEEADHFRFELIQWHKSFGILVLFLVFVRIAWRLTHRPPRLPSAMPAWERFAAAATHLFFYLLLLAIPVSGWIMVSASPLNLATELFGAIPWPHLPVTGDSGLSGVQRETLSEQSIQAHHFLANALLILVLLHIVAALRHQFVLRDNLMARMWVAQEHRQNGDQNHALLPGLLLAGAIGLFLWERVATEASDAALTAKDTPQVVATDLVGFTAIQMGEPVKGTFDSVTINLEINDDDPVLSVLNAVVQTASVNTGDSQIDSTVVSADWFASDQYPIAEFSSTAIDPRAETNVYAVSGNLTIRDSSLPIDFIVSIDNGKASGEFIINRQDYGIGTGGQDEFIDAEVTIRFVTTDIRE